MHILGVHAQKIITDRGCNQKNWDTSALQLLAQALLYCFHIKSGQARGLSKRQLDIHLS